MNIIFFSTGTPEKVHFFFYEIVSIFFFSNSLVHIIFSKLHELRIMNVRMWLYLLIVCLNRRFHENFEININFGNTLAARFISLWHCLWRTHFTASLSFHFLLLPRFFDAPQSLNLPFVFTVFTFPLFCEFLFLPTSIFYENVKKEPEHDSLLIVQFLFLL